MNLKVVKVLVVVVVLLLLLVVVVVLLVVTASVQPRQWRVWEASRLRWSRLSKI